MNILVLNCGSSSVKSQYFVDEKSVCSIHIDGIGQEICSCIIDFHEHFDHKIKVKSHDEAITHLLEEMKKQGVVRTFDEIDAVGHRVVHGGEKHTDSALVDPEVMKDIESFSEFAPLHNPANLLGIQACEKLLPGKKQVVVFDTSFHMSIPASHYLLPLPRRYYDRYKVRKYGFHGTSYRYLVQMVDRLLGKGKKMILCHEGNGSSICAVKDGKSLDTSMGFTPLPGVIMGTRSGDIDAGVLEFINEKEGLFLHEIISLLNHESGLKGICGDSDMRMIRDRIAAGDALAALALDMLVLSIVKYMAYYDALLGGAEVIVFSGGLGEHAQYLREKVIASFGFRGIKLDQQKNNVGLVDSDVAEIHAGNSSAKVLIIKTNEELMIAQETARVLKNQ